MGLSGGAIAGIVIGTLALLLVTLGALFFFWRRRKQKQIPQVEDTRPADSADEKPLSAAYPAVMQLDSGPVAEVEGTVTSRPSELPG